MNDCGQNACARGCELFELVLPPPTAPTPTPPTPTPPTPTPPTPTPPTPTAPTPTAPVPAPSCENRTDQWTIGTATRYWCTWAANGTDPPTRCRKKDLYTDCPVTCDSCPTSAPAPVATRSPSAGGCCDDIWVEVDTVKGRLDDVESNIQLILNILQSAPTAAPAAATCEDRTDKWALVDGGTIRNWCTWAADSDNPLGRCRKKDLYTDCPVTCQSGCP